MISMVSLFCCCCVEMAHVRQHYPSHYITNHSISYLDNDLALHLSHLRHRDCWKSHVVSNVHFQVLYLYMDNSQHTGYLTTENG